MELAHKSPGNGDSSNSSIKVIELHMMDKKRYFPLTMTSGFTIRTLLYPSSVIKTRLQVQRGKTIYNGTYDAFCKIKKNEGMRGLYRGFLVSQFLIVPQTFYIVTYESTRHFLQNRMDVDNSKVRSLAAGMTASLVSQTFVVPIDVISQHIMLISKGSTDYLRINDKAFPSQYGRTKSVILAVYKKYGLRGFYKGYLASLGVFVPNSAMWWFFYDCYCDVVASVAPIWMPRLMLQIIAAPLSGITTSLITNPLDTIRTRIQVKGDSFLNTAALLWKEDGWKFFLKGYSARVFQSISFSFFIILGYETIKRMSLLEEYKDEVRW